MSRFTLYTYEDLNEFNQLYKELEDEEKCIHNFVFQETQDLLKSDSEVIIDISILTEYLKLNPNDIQPAINNFIDLTNASKVIIKAQLADEAMDYFRLLFKNSEPLFEKVDQIDIENSLIPLKRKVLYTYETGLQLDSIIEYANDNEISFTNFSMLNGIENNNYRMSSDEEKKVILDITNVVKASIKNSEITYIFEQLLESFPYYDAIIREDSAEEALNSYRVLFNSKKQVSELLNGIILPSNEVSEESEAGVKRVIDLENTQLLYDNLSSQLIGHNEFKRRFEESLENFLILNSIGEEKNFFYFFAW